MKRLFKFTFDLIFPLVLLAVVPACQVLDRSSSGGVDNEQLAKQMSEMQEELRLVIKEVVALNTKLDKLTLATPSNANVADRVSVQVEMSEANRLGSPDAKYAIVEFMDYQCPYCVRHAKQVLPKIKSRYIDTGQLQYVIRDYPLPFHSEAEPAAVAANCAGNQSKYWEMHEQLVQNSRNLNAKTYTELARKIGLDANRFASCQKKDSMLAEVKSDFAYGSKIGTRGTPNFYIGKIEGNMLTNVQRITGGRPIEVFDRAIQQVMAADG